MKWTSDRSYEVGNDPPATPIVTALSAADLRELAELAAAATHGKWRHRMFNGEDQIVTVDTMPDGSPAEDYMVCRDMMHEDAEFIAACDPATITALVQMVEDAQAKMFKVGEALVNEQLATSRAEDERAALSADMEEDHARCAIAAVTAAEARAQAAVDETSQYAFDLAEAQQRVTHLEHLLDGLKQAHKVTARERDRQPELEAERDGLKSDLQTQYQCRVLAEKQLSDLRATLKVVESKIMSTPPRKYDRADMLLELLAVLDATP